MAKTKFKIDYTWDKKEQIDKIEKTLTNEGWYKTNWNTPNYSDKVKKTEVFTIWFERNWE